jgi:hypothetical protein
MTLLKPLFSTIAGVVLLGGVATPAAAQYVNDDPEAIGNFLDTLYSALEESPGAYSLATEEYSDQDNLRNAGSICEAFSYGASVTDIIQVFSESESIQALSPADQEVAGEYLGAVMAASGFYYCPEYGREPVLEFLAE